MSKTINDIRVRTLELFEDNQRDMGKTLETMQSELLAYYSTPDGRAEIDGTPHRGLSTEIAVELLMQDVTAYANTFKKV